MGSRESHSNDEIIDHLFAENYIHQRNIERALRLVDRLRFLPPESRQFPHLPERLNGERNGPFFPGPLHVSSIEIYSRILESLRLERGHTFLNVGSGSGFLSTVVGILIGDTGINEGIELYQNLIDYSNITINHWAQKKCVSSVGWARPDLRAGDVNDPEFWRNHQNRYDRINVGFVIRDSTVLCRMVRMLTIGGIMIVPGARNLYRYTRTSETTSNVETLDTMAFSDGVTLPVTERPATPHFEGTNSLLHIARQTMRRRCRVEAYNPRLRQKINDGLMCTRPGREAPAPSGSHNPNRLSNRIIRQQQMPDPIPIPDLDDVMTEYLNGDDERARGRRASRLDRGSTLGTRSNRPQRPEAPSHLVLPPERVDQGNSNDDGVRSPELSSDSDEDEPRRPVEESYGIPDGARADSPMEALLNVLDAESEESDDEDNDDDDDDDEELENSDDSLPLFGSGSDPRERRRARRINTNETETERRAERRAWRELIAEANEYQTVRDAARDQVRAAARASVEAAAEASRCSCPQGGVAEGGSVAGTSESVAETGEVAGTSGDVGVSEHSSCTVRTSSVGVQADDFSSDHLVYTFGDVAGPSTSSANIAKPKTEEIDEEAMKDGLDVATREALQSSVDPNAPEEEEDEEETSGRSSPGSPSYETVPSLETILREVSGNAIFNRPNSRSKKTLTKGSAKESDDSETECQPGCSSSARPSTKIDASTQIDGKFDRKKSGKSKKTPRAKSPGIQPPIRTEPFPDIVQPSSSSFTSSEMMDGLFRRIDNHAEASFAARAPRSPEFRYPAVPTYDEFEDDLDEDDETLMENIRRGRTGPIRNPRPTANRPPPPNRIVPETLAPRLLPQMGNSTVFNTGFGGAANSYARYRMTIAERSGAVNTNSRSPGAAATNSAPRTSTPGRSTSNPTNTGTVLFRVSDSHGEFIHRSIPNDEEDASRNSTSSYDDPPETSGAYPNGNSGTLRNTLDSNSSGAGASSTRCLKRGRDLPTETPTESTPAEFRPRRRGRRTITTPNLASLENEQQRLMERLALVEAERARVRNAARMEQSEITNRRRLQQQRRRQREQEHLDFYNGMHFDRPDYDYDNDRIGPQPRLINRWERTFDVPSNPPRPPSQYDRDLEEMAMGILDPEEAEMILNMRPTPPLRESPIVELTEIDPEVNIQFTFNSANYPSLDGLLTGDEDEDYEDDVDPSQPSTSTAHQAQRPARRARPAPVPVTQMDYTSDEEEQMTIPNMPNEANQDNRFIDLLMEEPADIFRRMNMRRRAPPRNVMLTAVSERRQARNEAVREANTEFNNRIDQLNLPDAVKEYLRSYNKDNV